MGCMIIAEAGVNHNGSLELAKRLVDEALVAGADCIKFQTFISENLVTKHAMKAAYQKENSIDAEAQIKMLKPLELSFENFTRLYEYCGKKGIEFMSTAFDLESADFLNSLGMNNWKISSGDITNRPLLEKIAQFGRPIILSTGMSTADEIHSAISVLKASGANNITLLHCTSEYPVQYKDVNLKAMSKLSVDFALPVGYSDHTAGTIIPIAAVAMGAVVLEKHFTLSRNMNGPDHKASLEPEELHEMIKNIRVIEESLGIEIKKQTHGEKNNSEVVRKSIVAKCKISKGERFSDQNITTKRPGTGISPMRWYDIIGMEAIRDFDEDELVEI